MFAIKRIDHIVLRTDKLDAMRRFYCELLSCTVERETTPALGLTQLRAGDCLIDLVTIDSELGRAGGAAPNGQNINLDHFCLLLKKTDLNTLLTYLEQQGIATDIAERYGAQGYNKSIYIHDPQGNRLELRIDTETN